MPTTITKTIGSSGRNYTTPALWEADTAAVPTNLVTADNVCVGQCFNDSEFVSATAILTLSGHTTDATRTITLTTGAGQSFRDNAGVQGNPLNYNATNGVGLRCTGGYANTVNTLDDNVILSNLQIRSDASDANVDAVASTNGTSPNNQINNCIVSGGGRAAYFNGTARNSLFINTGIGRNYIMLVIGTVKCYFCTFVCPSDVATPVGYGLAVGYGVGVVVENCAIFGATTAVNIGAATITTCMTNQASPPAGFTTETYANQFVNTTIASGDYREKTGANLQAAGTADATNGATDIAGTARPQGSNWDIGCWELIAAAPPPTGRGLSTLGVGH